MAKISLWRGILVNIRIEKIQAREVLGGSGRPTLDVEILLSNGVLTSASVPSGTSRGGHEAFELYDGDKRYGGYGVRQAVNNVNTLIADRLRGMSPMDLSAIDQAMLELDGTPDKHRLGGNAILPVSVAAAKGAALTAEIPLYRYLGGLAATRLPMPIATVIAGGEYSPSALPFEDFLYIVEGYECFADALEALAATRKQLEINLTKRFGIVADVGGALAPPIESVEQAFDIMLEAVSQTGNEGRMGLALDVAANELYDKKNDTYNLGTRQVGSEELTNYYLELVDSYPLRFIEDPFREDDYAAHSRLTKRLGEKAVSCSVVGDDLFATNPVRIAKGIEEKAATELLLKINQIGTVTEALDAGNVAREGNLDITVSLRSNDTPDSFISDLAVALGAIRLKAGSPVRAERNAKYNRLLAIESDLGANARFAGGLR